MARKLTSEMFNALVQRVERMADGIAKHKGEENFPPRLNDGNRRAKRQELEDLRETYEAAVTAADQAHDAYSAAFASLEKALAQDDETVRGLYGKANPVVAEFGTKIIAPSRSKKGSGTQTAQKA